MDFFYKKCVPFTLLVILAICIFFSCKENSTDIKIEESYDYLKVPEGFPEIPFPANNPYSKEKVLLGRWLFYEKILSRDSTISCSHCMKPEFAFSDPISVSIGDSGTQTRNSMSTINSAYRKMLFWDGRGSSIESPAYRSIFLKNVFGADTNVINERLRKSDRYMKMFKDAFGENTTPNCFQASQAIATFVRTLVSGNSRYDKYSRGDKSALNESEIRGLNLFFSDRTKCSVCHSGIFFTDMSFHNTGTTTHYFDRGRFYVTGNMEDRGKFLTPSLRNVELTAPYMHEGNFKNLGEVIVNYNMGGKKFINKDTLVKPLNLTYREKADLIAFLKSLTDWDFINNKWYHNPANQ